MEPHPRVHARLRGLPQLLRGVDGGALHFKQWGAWAVALDRDRDDPDWRSQSSRAAEGQRVINLEGGSGFHGSRVHWMKQVGKHAAGRELDGRTWDEFPGT